MKRFVSLRTSAGAKDAVKQRGEEILSRNSSGRREATVAAKIEAKRRAWSNPAEVPATRHRVFLGDARNLARILPHEQVHLIVTSPPYWDLKPYETAADGNQLGRISDRERFLSALMEVWGDCFNMLVPGGRMCVVVGDVCRSRRQHGRHLVEPLHAYLLVQCQELGFDPLAPIIWKKISNAKTEVAGNGARFLGKPYEPNAIVKNDVEYILMFRKPGGYRHPTQRQRDLSLIDKRDFSAWFQQVWEDVPGNNDRAHPATFPREIARRLIQMYSFVGDTVLDPFWGVGNTTLAAYETNRSSVGIEIEPSYIETAKTRFPELRLDTEVEYLG